MLELVGRWLEVLHELEVELEVDFRSGSGLLALLPEDCALQGILPLSLELPNDELLLHVLAILVLHLGDAVLRSASPIDGMHEQS